ncbi:interleukin-12 receptor subunit beta-2-like [Paramormyrops kingsleyae]|uniref:Interleukin-12 receptor subunit beta-2-like n=1 Tax=Paramormyrops kingsleyae TaxID=1676925 RepID=A0A3B3QZ99_9TELE|nr:interleukin-12 receptor subunit beta-2-like [Paramormyrops kingsleyae]
MLLQFSTRSAFALMILLCGTGAETVGKMCAAFSTSGTVVQPGTSFAVYCVFDNAKCKKNMYLDQGGLQAVNYNSTTIFSEIKNIRARKTSYEFACKCDCCLVPCGFYLTAGYPPDKPQNLTCIQVGINGNITCTWKTGRDPYVKTLSYILMKTSALNNTLKLTPRYSMNGTAFASLPTFGSHSEYTVWVTTSNKFGNVSSDSIYFTLSDIAKPPAPEITQVHCLSYSCIIHWKVKETTHLLQVKCRTDTETSVISSITGNTSGNLNVSHLEPFMQYEFQTRNKLDSERGVWSEWSNTVAARTDEEVPLKEMDVWYTESNLHSQEKLYRILWKELSVSEARGVILHYKVMVTDQLTRKSTELASTGLAVGPIRCSYCDITVSAYNSKGHSPVARIALPLVTVGPSPQNVVCQPISEQGLAISWQKPNTVQPLLGYLVEWFPTDAKSQDLGWKRTAPGDLRMVVKDVIHHRCYTGAVYALYAHGVGKEDFRNICSWPSVPTQGPKTSLKNWDNATVTVHWKHEGVCVTGYTIYLKSSGSQPSEKRFGPVHPYLKEYTTEELLPGEYDLWMTAWANAEEGPAGPTNHIFIDFKKNEKNMDMVLILTGLFASVTFLLACVCRIPTVKQRVTVCFRMIYNSIPDPANSIWAKECIAKGQLLPEYKFNASAVLSTEEHSTVEIQEDAEAAQTHETPGSTSSDVELICSPRSFSQSPSADRDFNQDKLMHSHIDNSAPAQHDTKPYTHPNVEYISSNGLQNISGEDDEDDENCLNDFFPCPQSPFMEDMVPCTGQLTLDDLKINCNVFTDIINM